MTNAEEQLAMIGFARQRAEPASWRSVRVNRPAAAASNGRSGPEPACSRALLRWRDLLAREPRRSPYRISRA